MCILALEVKVTIQTDTLMSENQLSRFEQLKNLLNENEVDFQKFYEKDNHAAGTRVRKGMQELKNMAQEIRNEINEMKHAKNATTSEG